MQLGTHWTLPFLYSICCQNQISNWHIRPIKVFLHIPLLQLFFLRFFILQHLLSLLFQVLLLRICVYLTNQLIQSPYYLTPLVLMVLQEWLMFPLLLYHLSELLFQLTLYCIFLLIYRLPTYWWSFIHFSLHFR